MDRDLEGRDRDLEPETKPRGDDVQQLVVVKEEVPPEQQEWSPSLDQEDPAEPPHIKEEQEELWTSQEGEQLQGLEEADITKFLFTPVPVKSEDDEEKPQSSQLHQRQTEEMETGADGEDCGGPEPARNSQPDPELGLVENEDFSETEDSPDSYLWKESIECPSGSKSEAPENHNTVQKLFSCSECGERFCLNVHLKRHMRIHTGKKPICCSFCGETFTERVNLSRHMVVHTGEKLFSCSECGKIFRQKGSLTRHKCLGPWSSRHNRSQMEENREPEPGASSSTEQMETGADGEDCGGPEPARNSSPDPHAHAYIEYEIEDSYPDPELGPETPDFSEMEDSEDFSNKTTEPQSHLKQTGCYKEAGLCARERAELRRAEAATMAKQGKLPIPALPEHSYTAYTRKHLKRKRTEEEKKEAKEAATQNRKGRCMTRIYIGPAFDRWKDLKESKGLKSDAQLALLLLDSYERDDATVSTPFKHRGKRPLTSTLPSVTRRSPESMSSVDLNETFRVEEFNSLNNATIDWEDDTLLSEKDDGPLSSSQEDVTREFDIDEDYVPRICVRSGGVLSSNVNIDNVPEVSIDQSVHDDGGEDGPDYIPDPDSAPDVHDEDDIVGHPASIAYHTSLQQLVDHLELPEHVCTVIDPSTMAKCGAPKPFTVRITSRGTAAIIEWICASGHTVWKWASQPFLNLGMPVGDFLLSCNVLLSGNNYAKIALLFKFMNMGMVHQTTFRNIQDIYCIDTIKDFWNTRRSEIITRLKQKDSVVALGGARMDSPGFCAQHCTYTTIDNDTKEIISVVNMDKRATARNSVIMQREAFIRTFDTLHEEVKLTEFCTDAHVQISSLFEKGKYKDSGVHHSLDMWHGAKILGEKIREAAQQKDCTILHEWNKDICNHFWHCCKMTDDFHTFFDKWTGVLHHVTGEHSPLTDNRDKHLIQKDSKAHQTLTEIVLNEQWLKSVGKYLHFRSTAELESFHNHILMYAGKRFGFSPPVYGARVLLAALDYNHHLSRSPKINAAGQYEYRKLYNKKSRKWTLRTLKETKSYSYIPALQRAVLHKRLSGGGMPSVKPRTPDDPRHQH